MPARRQVRKASKAKPAQRKRSTGEFSETGYTTPPRNKKTGQPTRRLLKAARSAAGLQSQLIVPTRAIEKSLPLLKKVGRAKRAVTKRATSSIMRKRKKK